MKFSDHIGKLILGIFILAHFVYHKISTSSLYGLYCNLIIPKIRCCFNVNTPIYYTFA